jgi:hypothetical protein
MVTLPQICGGQSPTYGGGEVENIHQFQAYNSEQETFHFI